MRRRRVEVVARAKINLDLRVLGHRPDRFHELRTVLQSIALHDTLSFVAQKGPFSLTCHAPGVPLDRSNLIWRAATVLWQGLGREGEPRDVAVTMRKRIPVQAGLGGGSSDAAAALVALGRLWGVRPTRAERAAMASRIGADVPFFLWGGTALGLGRGDEVYPLTDVPRHWIILMVPDFGVATADAYEWYDAAHPMAAGGSGAARHPPALWPIGSAPLDNDLEAPVARRHPDIVAVKAALRAHGAVAALLSGSGAAVFGLFVRRREAVAAMGLLGRAGWRAILSRTVDRLEYQGRLIQRAAAGARARRGAG